MNPIYLYTVNDIYGNQYLAEQIDGMVCGCMSAECYKVINVLKRVPGTYVWSIGGIVHSAYPGFTVYPIESNEELGKILFEIL